MFENVECKVEGKTLTITVNLENEIGLSKSEKSMMIASTHGNHLCPGAPGAYIGLTVYKKA